MQQTQRVRWVGRSIIATVVCFIVGALAGLVVLWGPPRPLVGELSLSVPAAGVAGVIAAAAFVVSTVMYRRGETGGMPRWQAVVSNLSAVSLTLAFAGITALGLLLAGQILTIGLQGLRLPMWGGAIFTGAAAATGGRFAFTAGVGLRTRDLASVLFGFLVIGTLFAMVTAADATWWQRNFSQLGTGAGAWAFNGTVIVAGLLIATVGAYIGRDLHRLYGDDSFASITWSVVLWAATGLALAAVGLLPEHLVPLPHAVAAVTALALLIVSAIATTAVLKNAPRFLWVSTAGFVLLSLASLILADPLGVFPVTVLEVIVVGICLLWMSTFIRTLAALTPDRPRASHRGKLMPVQH
ncbi:DUF998 domain-containing protein [Microbacterium sp. YY-01]|uniref:DUF998 domain-containing protein n=1 Tax=Microbacterium sp. YY-01 TaxID=3421634 RepID=UPI003D171E51